MKSKSQAGKRSPSLRRISKYLLWLVVIITAIIGLLLYRSFNYSANYNRTKTQAVIDARTEKISRDLYNVSYYLFNLVVNDSEVDTVRTSQNINIRNTAARTLWDNLEFQGQLFESLYSFMIYAPAQSVTIHSHTATIPYNVNVSIETLVKEGIQNGEYTYNTYDWNTIVVSGEAYLMQIYRHDDIYTVSWVSCGKLLAGFTDTAFYQKPELVFLDQDNQPIIPADAAYMNDVRISSDQTIQGKGGRDYYYFALNRTNLRVLFSMAMAFDYPHLLFFSAMYFLILLIIIGFYGYTLIYFKRYIERPLRTLNNKLSSYKAIRTSAKKKGFAELEMANEAFDSLNKQIESLKIDFYEEKLLQAKTELDYYQLQIKPHFFINCLSIIFSMSEKQEYTRIQDFCICLSNYLRYHFTNTYSMVPLHEELLHLHNYLRIQSIRYRDSTNFRENIAPELEAISIPPLVLVTFVENSIKYSGLAPGELTIALDIKIVAHEQGDMLHIDLTDNGNGFAADKMEMILRELQNDTGDKRQSIGISNVFRRLELLYGEQFVLELSNSEDSGAHIHIEIPISGSKE